MEKFELTVVAQGSQSIWVAVLVVALVCTTIIAIVASFTAAKLWQGHPGARKKRRSVRTRRWNASDPRRESPFR
jgi:hypothetical protein